MNERKISTVKPKLTAKERKEERAQQNKLKREQDHIKSLEAARNRPSNDQQAMILVAEIIQNVQEFEVWFNRMSKIMTFKAYAPGTPRCVCCSPEAHDRKGHFIGDASTAVNEKLRSYQNKITQLEGKARNLSPRVYDEAVYDRLRDKRYQNEQDYNLYYPGEISKEGQRIAQEKLGIEYVEDEVDHEIRKMSSGIRERIAIPEGCRIGKMPIVKYLGLSKEEFFDRYKGKMLVQRCWVGEMVEDRDKLLCNHYHILSEGYLGYSFCQCPQDDQGVLIPISDTNDMVVDRGIYRAQLDDKAECLRHDFPPYNIRKGTYSTINLVRLGLDSPENEEFTLGQYVPSSSSESEESENTGESPE